MPTHLTRLANGAVVPANAQGREDGYPFVEMTNHRLHVADTEVYTPVVPTMVMPNNNYAVDHTLTEADMSQRLRFTATATLTLPADSVEDLPLNTIVQVFVQTGTLTVAAGAGATVVNNTGPFAAPAVIHIVKDAADTWLVY